MQFRWLSVVALVGCSGGAQQIEIGPTPPKQTSGTFVGPLCGSPNECTCRDVNAAADGGAGVPTDGTKRYEVRLKSPNQLWAKVRDNVMYKSAERVEACFYVDLPTGDNPVELRASEPNGVAASWEIREL